MTTMQLLFHGEARHRIQRGIDQLAEALKIALGPRSRTVLLEATASLGLAVDCGVAKAPAAEPPLPVPR